MNILDCQVWDNNYFQSAQYDYWKLIFFGLKKLDNGEYETLYNGLYFRYPELFVNWE